MIGVSESDPTDEKPETLRPPAVPVEMLLEKLAELPDVANAEVLSDIVLTFRSYHQEHRAFRTAFWQYVEDQKAVQDEQNDLLRRAANVISIAMALLPQPPAVVGNKRLSGIRVLLVDDDAGILSAFGRLLAREGAFVTGSLSAEEGLRELGENVFDVAIVDVSMPGMGGPDFIEILVESYRETKPIILSGYSRDIVCSDILTDRLRVLEVPVLEKPLSQFSMLVEAIQKAAGRAG